MTDTSALARFRAHLWLILNGFWRVAPVYIFFDKVLFAFCLFVIGATWTADPMKLDVHYKIGITVIALGVAYVAANAIYLNNKKEKEQEKAEKAAAPTQSPANDTGKAKDGYELVGTIFGLGMGNPTSQPQDTSVFIIANVRNVGAPTIASDWALQVTTPGGKVIEGRNRFINPDYPLELSKASGEPMVLSPEDALYMKASSNPIPSGGQVTGVIIFDLVNTKKEDVLKVGTVVVLSFTDVTGKKYSASRTISSLGEEGLMYYPGMKPPLKSDTGKSEGQK
jgi:hypothetical protein